MTDTVIVHWFRQDLRLSDLPALQAVHRAGAAVLPLYILDDDSGGEWAPGSAARWWLHHSLAALCDQIADRGGKLLLRRGDSLDLLLAACEASGARRVHCTRRYEPWATAQEQAVHKALAERGIEFKRYPGSLLLEPGQVLTRGGAPFRVFSPFWRACQRLPIANPVALDDDMLWSNGYDGEKLDDWDLTPGQPDWAAHWTTHWRPGEQGAWARAERFFRRSRRRLRDGSGSTGRRRDLAAVAAPAPRGDLPAPALGALRAVGLGAAGAGNRPRQVPRRTRVERVLLSPAAFFSEPSGAGLQSAVRALSLASQARGTQRLAARANRLPDCRRGHARTLAHRAYAQSGAHGGRVFSLQTPADSLAARRRLVLGYASGR